MTDDNLTEVERQAKDRLEREREEIEQNALPYRWKQTLPDVDIIVQVPQGTRAKQLNVEIKKQSLLVGLKGISPIIDGLLSKEVKVDDCTWTLDNQKEIFIHLEKKNDMEWWDSVIKGHPKIDTTKIQPENSKLSDLDGETRAMVEKMMFDQHQKAAGKPSSDELKKLEMLEKFKSQHPEMDFSNVKMS